MRFVGFTTVQGDNNIYQHNKIQSVMLHRQTPDYQGQRRQRGHEAQQKVLQDLLGVEETGERQ